MGSRQFPASTCQTFFGTIRPLFTLTLGDVLTHHTDCTCYLRALRLPGTGRMLHSKPMAAFPLYVPPKLISSATKKKKQKNINS